MVGKTTTAAKAPKKTGAPKAAKAPKEIDPTMLKKPELLDAVVTRTGLKKRDIKPAVEAALAVISDALAKDKTVNLPPLGKLRMVKSKPMDGGAAVMTLKLRTPKNATAASKDTSDDG